MSNPANGTIHRILGTGTGVSTNNGPRDDDETSITVSIHTRAEELALKALLVDQTPIQVNISPAKGIDFTLGYYQVLETSDARLSQAPNMPFRSYLLPMVKVNSPVASQVDTGYSWAQLNLDTSSWADVKTSYGPWANVQSGTRL